MGKARFYILAFAFTLLFAGTAQARLFGLVFDNGPVMEFGLDAEDTSNRAAPIGETSLYEIDPDTGQALMIGSTGHALCVGMDFHPVTKELYAVCAPNIVLSGVETKVAPVDYSLVKIDIHTGQATEIGPTGIIPGGIGLISDISFRSEGVLFGHGVGKDGLILGTFDLHTGEFTLTGPAELDVDPGGLAFLADGRLFSADTSIKVVRALNFDTPTVLMHLRDQATGAADFITELKLTFNETQRPIVTSMDTSSADGLLYGYLYAQGGKIALSAQKSLEFPEIAVFDPDTGIVDRRVPTIENVTAIAFLDIQRNIPTMGEWGLIILASLLLLGSLIVLKGRHKTSAV